MIRCTVASKPVLPKLEVSVIIPARNEEASLPACLESLVNQGGITFEIIVVDDGSTDRTSEIAKSFKDVKVTTAPPLPLGWTGKNNAMAAGARQGRGAWFLFTDADTVHLPGSLSSSVREAREQKAALLSYSPEQEVHGILQKAVMPVIFAELATTYRPAQVSDRRSPAAAANGQYLLISRDAYEAVGGHAAVATTLLEDVALAKAVKATRRRIFFRYAPDRVRARMYRSFPQLVEGWTKNLALLFPHPVRLALLRLTEFVLIASTATLAAIASFGHRWKVAAVLALVATSLYAIFLHRIRKAHFAWDAELFALIGLPLFAFLLLRSQRSFAAGSVEWKGRNYSPHPATGISTESRAKAG